MVHQVSHKNFLRKLFGSKLFLFFISLALIGLVISVGRESYRKYQLNKEISRLKSEIEQLEGKNQQLAGLMEYFQEESYLEREARLKLNLKKPGEQVVVLSQRSGSDAGAEKFSDESSVNESISEESVEARNQEIETANYWRWWEYFFGQ